MLDNQVRKTRPVNHGVKLPTRWRKSCSECYRRTPVMLSCFFCAKVLCENCRISSPSEFAVVIGNKRGVCRSCCDLIQLENQGSSTEYDSGSDDDLKEVTSEAEDRMSSTQVPDYFRSDIRNESCLASLVGDNIKLVYMKKSLVEELMKEQPGRWKSKVVGSFVRFKTPKDSSRRTDNDHQLAQVQGVVEDCVSGEFFLQVLSNYVKRDIPVSQISDSDFTHEECEDLRQDVANCRLLRRPTVFELQHKARELHEDITKHWIRNELVWLQKRVDWLNEKGRTSEKLVCLDQRELLKKEYVQERLLNLVREVIAD